MEENKNTLGGFEAIFDSFIPKVNKEETEEIIDSNNNSVQAAIKVQELVKIKTPYKLNPKDILRRMHTQCAFLLPI